MFSTEKSQILCLVSLMCFTSIVFCHQGKHEDEHFTLDIEHEREHIKEHLDDIVQKKEEEMTDEELQFHYFKLHDYNDDDKLDGCEIFKAMSHAYNEMPSKEEEGKTKRVDVEPIAKSVDELLIDIDLDGDGYITYPEYKKRYGSKE